LRLSFEQLMAQHQAMHAAGARATTSRPREN
jgi:hypothetical protein